VAYPVDLSLPLTKRRIRQIVDLFQAET